MSFFQTRDKLLYYEITSLESYTLFYFQLVNKTKINKFHALPGDHRLPESSYSEKLHMQNVQIEQINCLNQRIYLTNSTETFLLIVVI